MPLDRVQLGHFQLLELIGRGKRGEVYRAQDTSQQYQKRQVAVKVLSSTTLAQRQWQRELRALGQLDHPHILPLLDFGETQVNETAVLYFVMPLCADGSFAAWLQQRAGDNPLALHECAAFVQQASAAVQYLHECQIVHQDVTLANFLIRYRPETSELPELLLSEAGLVGFSEGVNIAELPVRGTPGFMAPEQWNGQVLPATDQYALAAIAYRLLTGRMPFRGTPTLLKHQHCAVLPQALSPFNPQIPLALDLVILRALSKKAEERFPSVAAFAEAFQQALPPGSTAQAPRTTRKIPAMHAEPLAGTGKSSTNKHAAVRTDTNKHPVIVEGSVVPPTSASASVVNEGTSRADDTDKRATVAGNVTPRTNTGKYATVASSAAQRTETGKHAAFGESRISPQTNPDRQKLEEETKPLPIVPPQPREVLRPYTPTLSPLPAMVARPSRKKGVLLVIVAVLMLAIGGTLFASFANQKTNVAPSPTATGLVGGTTPNATSATLPAATGTAMPMATATNSAVLPGSTPTQGTPGGGVTATPTVGSSPTPTPQGYSFEDGHTDGWGGLGTGVSNVSNSTIRAKQGTHSLKATIYYTSGLANPYVAVVSNNKTLIPQAGQTVSMYVYPTAPSGSSTIQARLVVKNAANASWNSLLITLTPNIWNYLIFTIPKSASPQLVDFGVQFSTTPAKIYWTVFIDAVKWS